MKDGSFPKQHTLLTSTAMAKQQQKVDDWSSNAFLNRKKKHEGVEEEDLFKTFRQQFGDAVSVDPFASFAEDKWLSGFLDSGFEDDWENGERKEELPVDDIDCVTTVADSTEEDTIQQQQPSNRSRRSSGVSSVASSSDAVAVPIEDDNAARSRRHSFKKAISARSLKLTATAHVVVDSPVVESTVSPARRRRSEKRQKATTTKGSSSNKERSPEKHSKARLSATATTTKEEEQDARRARRRSLRKTNKADEKDDSTERSEQSSPDKIRERKYIVKAGTTKNDEHKDYLMKLSPPKSPAIAHSPSLRSTKGSSSTSNSPNVSGHNEGGSVLVANGRRHHASPSPSRRQPRSSPSPSRKSSNSQRTSKIQMDTSAHRGAVVSAAAETLPATAAMPRQGRRHSITTVSAALEAYSESQPSAAAPLTTHRPSYQLHKHTTVAGEQQTTPTESASQRRPQRAARRSSISCTSSLSNGSAAFEPFFPCEQPQEQQKNQQRPSSPVRAPRQRRASIGTSTSTIENDNPCTNFDNPFGVSSTITPPKSTGPNSGKAVLTYFAYNSKTPLSSRPSRTQITTGVRSGAVKPMTF